MQQDLSRSTQIVVMTLAVASALISCGGSSSFSSGDLEAVSIALFSKPASAFILNVVTASTDS
jgi:hypothetical protein